MAHSKLNRDAMFDWIERCLAAEAPTPDDAAIVERFNFTSTEQARTLLADLADAGRITIKGYGEGRVIALGRSRTVPMTMVRPTPTITRADPDLDRGVAKIRGILDRGALIRAGGVVAVPTPPLPAQTAPKPIPQPAQEPAPMSAKSIQLPASATAAIAAVEARAKVLGASLGTAAADLIVAGAQTIDAENAAPVTLAGFAVDDILVELGDRLSGTVTRADAAALEARAEAAERKLALFREVLA